MKNNIKNNATKKHYSASTIAKRAKAMARAGATWEEIEAALFCSRSKIRPIVKDTYLTERAYNENFLKPLRNNKKARQAAAKVTEPIVPEGTEVVEEIHEVIVTETGYLMDAGVSGILGESLDIFIPHFCLNELEKLSRAYEVASELLSVHYSTNRFTTINLYGKEILFEHEDAPVKKRSFGVVAVCCELFAQGFKVRLLTNSREIAELAEEQGCDINVVLKQS